MNSELIEKLEDECQAKASRIKKLEAELDLGMKTMARDETAIYTLIRHRGMLERALIMLRNASLQYKMDKDDLEIEDANAALAAVSESHEYDYDMKALADRIDEHIAQPESQREADVLRDEMAAHADYRERAQAGQTTEDDEEIYGHGDDSESDCEDAESADEKPDGQAENTLPNDTDRCKGVWIEDGDYHSGWREGCEKCLRRTAPITGYCVMITPPEIIAFECEFLIEPTP